MRNSCIVRPVDPKSLTEEEFVRLNEVTQDMWAHGIWELVQCECCGKMMSKQDIFWHLAKEIYDETVKKIMQTLDIKEIPCIDCGGETRFIYWEDNVENIRERLLRSEDSFLAICEHPDWGIVGYWDVYIDSMEKVFSREFMYHYAKVWLPEVSNRVNDTLGYTPEVISVFSSIWALAKYSNPFLMLNLLKSFCDNAPSSFDNIAGIMELDRWNIMHRVFVGTWWKSLQIHNDDELNGKIENTWMWYKSDIVVFDSPARDFRISLNNWVKNFFKTIRR